MEGNFIASWETSRGLLCSLKLNSLSKLDAVRLAKQYNSERVGDDPVLREFIFVDDESYRVELFADGRVIGLASIAVSVSLNPSNPLDIWLGLGVCAVFVINEYRTLVDGNVFGLRCGWALEEVIAARIFQHKPNIKKFTVSTVVDAHCLSLGGINFCKGFAEHYQEDGDFEYELKKISNNQLKKYNCRIELAEEAISAIRTIRITGVIS